MKKSKRCSLWRTRSPTQQKSHWSFWRSSSINKRILTSHFGGNPVTTVIVHYAPVEGSDDSEQHYNILADTIKTMPGHNLLLVIGDCNALIGTDDALYTYLKQTNSNYWSYQSWKFASSNYIHRLHKSLRFYQKERDASYSQGLCIPTRLVDPIGKVYEEKLATVLCPDGETEFFKIMLQGDTLAPYLFIISFFFWIIFYERLSRVTKRVLE